MKKRKKLGQNLLKSLLSVIGLSVKELRALKVGGLIVTLLMARVGTKPVADPLVKKEKNTLPVGQPPELARKEVVVSHGGRKVLKENEVVKRGTKQWNLQLKKLDK